MNREILRLAVPNIISNLTVPLLGVVDTALMGHAPNKAHLGAIAVGSMIFNFLYWGFGFLRMGTTGLTAQAYGQDDHATVISLLSRAVLTALVASLLLILLQMPIVEAAFWLVESSAEVEAFGRNYFGIRIYAAPATIALYAFYGWFMGMQNSRYVLIVSLAANLTNVVANVALVYGLGYQSGGIALGTLIAQSAGLIVAIGLFLNKYRAYLGHLQWEAVMQVKAIRRFFAVNGDIFIRTLCLIFTFSFFTAKSSAMGETILGVNQIYLQFIYILAFGVDGFAFASESLVGRFTGNQDQRGLRQAVWYSFYWGTGLAVLVSLVYGVLGQPLVQFFTDKAAIIEQAKPFLIWVIIAPLANAPAFIWDGVYIGATQSKPMRNTLLVATFGVFLPVYFFTKPALGNHGLWLAFTAFMVARGIMLSAYAPSAIFGLVRQSEVNTSPKP